ncbi:hypothetical protein HY932_00090 [Candidatus Falkowbacteria bacterium]|nr:hypothetical protein [Candidatus Falkowbacteria bacterium]
MFGFFEKQQQQAEPAGLANQEVAKLKEVCKTPEQQTAAELFSASSEFLEKRFRTTHL